MIEEWRPIEGYEGIYEVSSYGRVRSLDRYVRCKSKSYRLKKGSILSPAKDKNGYLKVVLSCNRKCNTINVHRLVAQAFIPNPDNLPEVNHKDEDKTNNSVDNLEWCNHSYNINYGTRKERERDTKMKNGWWTGLSEKEYRKKYYQDNKDRICEWQKEYRRKKMIQNNV